MAIPFFYLILISLSIVFCFDKAQTEGEKVALLAFKSSVGKSLRWRERDSPCSWTGIVCEQGRVVELRLPRSGLTGYIPKDTIGNLTKIRTLHLSFNDLLGKIPEDIGKCADLENVLLQGNHLSGQIPSSIFQLRNLIRLNLAGNKFTGEISQQFETLIKLNTLYLQNNQLTGFVPGLSLSNLSRFNVSYNQLTGSVPENLRNKFGQNAFLGTSSSLKNLNFSLTDTTVLEISKSRSREKSTNTRRIIIGVIRTNSPLQPGVKSPSPPSPLQTIQNLPIDPGTGKAIKDGGKSEGKSGGKNVGKIAGKIVGILVAVGVSIAAACYFYFRRTLPCCGKEENTRSDPSTIDVRREGKHNFATQEAPLYQTPN